MIELFSRKLFAIFEKTPYQTFWRVLNTPFITSLQTFFYVSLSTMSVLEVIFFKRVV